MSKEDILAAGALQPWVQTAYTVSRSQLLAAIDLFFEDRDPVSVQVLAGNARELLESLCRFREIEPMTELLLRDHPDHAKKDSRFEALTRREQEVFGLVTTGLMNKQVASELGVSEITAKVHRGNVMRKMGARSLADLVRMADALGIRQATH